jgi:acetolactate synthase-1/2/3 large subunit
MKMTGAQAVLHSLQQAGVSVVFGYPGGAIMPLYDALYDVKPPLRHVLVRHEQGAVHAAEGYARVSGKTGVCLATSGPGATNLITGMADAMMDSVPLVCITGQVPSHLLGTDAFQEADIVGMTLSVTKWSYQVTQASEIADVLAKAFYLANNGRPGPVLVDITKDAQFATVDFNDQTYIPKKTSPSSTASLTQAAQFINQAKKPYLLVGQGVLLANAENALQQFAEKTDMPVASTLLGLSAFPPDHPLYVGMLGMHGNYSANVLTNEADLLVAVGMRFDDRVTGNLEKYAKQAKVVHIDIDPAEINKNVFADVGVVMDAKAALTQLLPLVNRKQHHAWRQAFHLSDQQEYEKVISAELQPVTDKLKMAEVVHALAQKTQGNATIVTDVGQHQMVTARYYPFKKNRGHITSGGLGTMGFALPAAVGAQVAAGDQTVIAVMGDGGFQMTLQELGVIAQENLPVKMMILNNQYLGMVRQWQELFFEKRYSFTEMKNPDFVKLAQSYGIAARKVVSRETLSDALDEMLQSPMAYLLEVLVERQENIFPMMCQGDSVGDMRLE